MLTTAKRGIDLLRIGMAAKQVRTSTDEQQRRIAQKALAEMFSNARGVAMKIGQLFATDDDSPFRDLLDNVKPYPLADVLPVLEESLGQPVNAVFKSIDESTAAASLGQVHHAVLQSGEQVAVKIQYPHIANAVASEMKLAGLLPGFGPVKKWGFELEDYKRELKENMERELDYGSEAERQQRFHDAVKVDGLIVPKVHTELGSSQVLVQSWEQGVSIDMAKDWESTARQGVAQVLLKTLFKSLFVAGEIHGDPHMGNYFYRKTSSGKPQVVLLDYGCTVPVDESARLALLKLIIALREQQDVSPMQCFVAMGFDAKKLSYIDKALPMLSRVLLRPFLQDTKFRSRDWRIQHDMDSLLGEHKWWFRSAGPANLFLLIRGFQGLVQNLEKLQAFQDWWALLEEAVGSNLIDQARKLTLPELPVEYQASRIQTLAKDLKVKVWENDRATVAVSMPAEAVLDFDTIIPENVLQQLQSSKEVDLDEVMKRVRDSGVTPQVLFDYQIDAKRYKVWLE